MKKEYVVYGNESGELESFKTLEEAKEYIQDLKMLDKEKNIIDTYYIIEEEN